MAKVKEFIAMVLVCSEEKELEEVGEVGSEFDGNEPKWSSMM